MTVKSSPKPPDWLCLVPEKVRSLVAEHLPPGLLDGIGRVLPELAPRRPEPGAATFLARSFTGPTGTRPYKLFVPASYRGQRVALVVMLHGCTQSPDDFAAGTGMNAVAERDGFLVAYPGQTSTANPQRCWNWFKPGDQVRDSGEPAVIAGITRQVMREYAVDPSRVYVAGLSAGGAAAAIMGDAYPDLYAAVGVHSGLPCGAARDLRSAMAAMRSGTPDAAAAPSRVVPTIVFHGDHDRTVHPDNADAVLRRAVPEGQGRAETSAGQAPGGRAYDRTVRRDRHGRAVAEQWRIRGAGHAWSGGSSAGTYTDPAGPDATSEMLRFFREHRHPAPGRLT